MKCLEESWSKTLKSHPVYFHLYKMISTSMPVSYKTIDTTFLLAVFLQYFLTKPYTSIKNDLLSLSVEPISWDMSNTLDEKKYLSFLATFKLLTFKLNTFKFSFVKYLFFIRELPGKTKGMLRCIQNLVASW